MKLVKELPEIFEEFGEQKRKAFLEIKEYKEKGVPVIGMYCAYFPSELAMAIGAIPVGLCSFNQDTVQAAESVMPKSMCPLVKSSYGFALEDKCPFFHFADLVIGETTCDGKKKMYEMLSEMKPVFVMELPNSQSKAALDYWKMEIIRTKEYIEDFFRIPITEQMMKDAIHLGNEIRTALKNLCGVMKLNPAPVTGMDIQKMVLGSKYRFDFQNTPEIVNEVTKKILLEYKQGKMLEYRPRVLITGCPIGGDSLKVVKAIEENGGVVVAFENCSGVKTLNKMIDETNPDIYEAIAEKYLATGCSIMTPNDNRIDLIGEIIDEYSVDAVVEVVLSGCHSTGAESIYIRKFVTEEKGMPYLAIDTDYSQSDYGQISTRISALLEMVTMEQKDLERLDLNHCYKLMFSGLTKGEKLTGILNTLWEYTRIPMVMLDNRGQVIFYAGIAVSGDWKKFAYPIEIQLSENGGKMIADSPSLHTKKKVEELLSSVEKIYQLKNQKETEPGQNEEKSEKNGPDYLWVLMEKEGQLDQLQRYLSGEVHFMIEEMDSMCRKILFANVSGKEDRAQLIDACEEYAKSSEIRIVVGNGFTDKKKAAANCRMQERLFEMALEKNLRKRVYLIEDFYQELVVDYVKDKVGEEIFRLEELELLKREDTEKESELCETLYWYLRMKRNTSQTAARLRIHRNTLLHRISRINEIFDLDEKDGVECERLLMAMQLERAFAGEDI